MAHTWDQEMMRLLNRIGVLEKENRMLRSTLLEAIGITDAALADGGGRKEQLEPELPLFRPLKERRA
jgi:predicted ATPase